MTQTVMTLDSCDKRLQYSCVAGDWVNMGKFEHGSKGLCQERAYVSGIEAANALARIGGYLIIRGY